MKQESHFRALEETFTMLRLAALEGVEKWQSSIGFHCSAGAMHLLEMYLHQNGLIDPGTMIKHDSFVSEKMAREQLSMPIPGKDELIGLLVSLEKKRNILCYGKPQPKAVIEGYILTFNAVKDFLEQLGVRYE